MNAGPVNSSEQFVYDICKRSFLSMWSYNNPIKKKGKELCDILVVCDPHVVVISVKERLLVPSDDPAVAIGRWHKKTIEASKKQLYSAAKWLKNNSRVIRHDGSFGLSLPPLATRQLHLITVAFGSEGHTSIAIGDEGRDYIHIMTDTSFKAIVSELDTITDFLNYLVAKRKRPSKTSFILLGDESQMLAFYLMNNRSFPTDLDFVILDDGLLESFQKRPDYKKKKQADLPSYVWDRFIESFTVSKLTNEDRSAAADLTEAEVTLRLMSKEHRFHRRLLGEQLASFATTASDSDRARLIGPVSDTVYVLVHYHHSYSVDYRMDDLYGRCCVARHIAGRGNAVVGIATARSEPGVTVIMSYDTSSWTDQDDKHAAALKEKRRYFAGVVQHQHAFEYPDDANRV